MFNRIMTATDIVTIGDAPVISTARMARQQGARLYLLHVMESASTENRRRIRHFETGVEMIADADYEVPGQCGRARRPPGWLPGDGGHRSRGAGPLGWDNCRRRSG